MPQLNIEDGVNVTVSFSSGTTIAGQSPGGSPTQIQYNDGGSFGGVPGTGWDGLRLTLGDVGNIAIGGGQPNQFLRNLSGGVVDWSYVGAIISGTSMVDIPEANGNIQFTVDGLPRRMVVDKFSTLVEGNLLPGSDLEYDLGNGGNRWLNIWAGDSVNVGGSPITGNSTHITIANLESPNISGNFTGNVSGGTLSGDGWGISNINGANIIGGAISSANTANYAANVTGAAQPNITSVGTLVGLTVDGPLAVSVGNLNIPGGNPGDVLKTGGASDLYWEAVSLSRISNGTSNVNIQLSQPVTISASGVSNVAVFGSANTTLSGDLVVGDEVVANRVSTNNITTGNLTSTLSNIGYAANVTLLGGDSEQFLQTISGDGNVQWNWVRQLRNGNSRVTVDSNHWIHFDVAGINDVLVVTEDGIITGSANLGNINDVWLGGGTPGQVLTTDGAGNLYWATGVSTPGGMNTEIQFNNNQVFDGIPGTGWDGVRLLLGNNSSISILGGQAGQVLTTDGMGVMSWTTPPGGGFVPVPSANVALELDAAGNSNVKVGGGAAGQVLKSDGAGNMVWAADDGGIPGAPVDSLQWNNGGTFDGVTSTSYNGVVLTLGSNSEIAITGGNSGAILTTDGTGALSWTDPLSQPVHTWTSTAGQTTFNDPSVGSFASNSWSSVFVNGVLASPTEYQIVGDDIIFTVGLAAGEEVLLQSIGGLVGGGGGAVGNIAVLNLDGNVGNVLRGDGTWGTSGGGGGTSGTLSSPIFSWNDGTLDKPAANTTIVFDTTNISYGNIQYWGSNSHITLQPGTYLIELVGYNSWPGGSTGGMTVDLKNAGSNATVQSQTINGSATTSSGSSESRNDTWRFREVVAATTTYKLFFSDTTGTASYPGTRFENRSLTVQQIY